MAFSLKGLLKGGKKKRKEGDSGLAPEDDPFAPSGPEEIPAMEAEKRAAGKGKAGKKGAKGKKTKGKKTPGLLARLLPKRKKKGPALDGDPFDNPEVMALIASEVAALPPPETEAETAEAPPPPEKAEDETSSTGGAATEEDLGPYLEEPDAVEAAAAEAAQGGAEGAAPDDGLPPMTAEEDEAFGAFAAMGMEDDGEAEAAYFRRKRRRQIVGSSIAAAILVALGAGGWWLWGQIPTDEAGDGMPGPGGGLQVHNESEGLAPPSQAQSGDRIRMALPPPPSAEDPATRGGERSLARRPWLQDGPVSGETAPDAPAEEPTETAEAPPAPDEAAPAPEEPAAPDAEPETGTETAATEPAPEAAPEATEAPPPPAAPALAEDGDQPRRLRGEVADPQLAGLPELDEPKRPPNPADSPAAAPSFDALPAAPDQPQGLAAAPDPALVRQGPLGALPVVANDGRTAWQTYGRPFPQTGTPRVTLIVAGLGLNPAATEAAITRLPPGITLSFSPYAKALDAQLRKARSYGHEVMLDLPMEPENFPARDPGPLAMLTALPQNDNLTRLETIMGKGAGYTGFLGRMGGKYGANRAQMRTVLESLSQRGLLYVHTAPPEGLAQNADLGVPSAQSLMAIDERPFREAIDARLKYVAEAAKIRGSAVAVAHPYPVTFERIARFAGQLQTLGVALAPASASVRIPATTAAAQEAPRDGDRG